MAFHGDLFSFPLPELLQWLDSSRKTGTLQLRWEGGERKLFLDSGQVVGASNRGLWERIARLLRIAGVARGETVMEAFAELKRTRDAPAAFTGKGMDPQDPMSLAREELYGTVVDLTLGDHGEFTWSEDTDWDGEEWVPLELGLRALVFESLRWMDEAPEVERSLPADTVVVRSLVAASPEHPLLHRIILKLCEGGQSLGQLRLTLGLSRASGARRVFDLLRMRLVTVEGMGEFSQDPMAQMLENGLTLVQEKQFDAAGLVFSALLQTDPSDRRVREFARMVEAEHIASLYENLAPLSVFQLVNSPELLAGLRPEERQVANLVNGIWDVSTITLASPARELDTLKSLNKLLRMGMLRPSTLTRVG